MGGRRSSSIVGIRSLSSLTVQASFPCCRKILTRSLPPSGDWMAKSTSLPSDSSFCCRSSGICRIISLVSSSVSCMGEYSNAPPNPDEHGQPLGNMNIRTARLASHGYDCMNVHQLLLPEIRNSRRPSSAPPWSSLPLPPNPRRIPSAFSFPDAPVRSP